MLEYENCFNLLPPINYQHQFSNNLISVILFLQLKILQKILHKAFWNIIFLQHLLKVSKGLLRWLAVISCIMETHSTLS